MAKLQETTGSMIGMDIFILNMELRMRECVALCYAILQSFLEAWSAEQYDELLFCCDARI